MIKNLHILSISLLLTACATKPTWESQLNESEKPLFQKSNQTFDEIIKCATETEGNDARFSAECTPLLKADNLYIKLKELNSTKGAYKITGLVNLNKTVQCVLDGKQAETENLKDLKLGQNLTITGSITKFSSEEKKVLAKRTYKYEAQVTKCKIL